MIIFGKLHIKDTFTTPLDCKILSVDAKVGPYFTGWYIFGEFVWPALRLFEPRWFTPGLQYVEITGTGFGIVTFWVNGSS